MRRSSPLSALVASALLASATVALPLARGGVSFGAEAVAVAVAIVAFASARPRAIPAPAVLLVGVVAVQLLQVVPLPPPLHYLSPGARRVFQISLEPIAGYPAVRPLSLDPAASAWELAKACACTLAFITTYALKDSRRARAWLLLGVRLAGPIVALVVLGAALGGAEALLAPRFPFVNPNHLAGLLNLSAFAALGAVFSERGSRRMVWALVFAATGTVSILSLSRGGIAAFLFGSVVFATLAARGRAESEDRGRPTRTALLIGSVGTVVALASYLAVAPIVTELETIRSRPNDAKIAVLRPALQMIGDFPILGIGRGSFGTVFSGYQLESSGVTFTHVENEWLQGVIDFGIPAGVSLVAAFLWIWIVALSRSRSSFSDVGLLAGTAALGAQNAVDFSLEILGVAVPFVVAMGLLAHNLRSIPIGRRMLAVSSACVALIIAIASGIAWRHPPTREFRGEGAKTSSEITGAASQALRWRPADWIPHATVGIQLVQENRCSDAMPWLVRAMALSPLAPAPHLAAARCLATANPAASKREFRLAMLFGLPALPEAARVFPSARDLLEIAPSTPDGLLALGDFLSQRGSPGAATAYERVLTDFVDDRAALPLARLVLNAGDPSRALELARRRQLSARTDAQAYEISAAALSRLGRDEEAQAELERGLLACPGSAPLLRALTARAVEARRWSLATRLAEEIAPTTPAELADKHMTLAYVLAGQGRISEAIERARSAAGARPDDPSPLFRIAEWAQQLHRYDDAIDSIRRATSILGSVSPEDARRIRDLERARDSARDSERHLLIDGDGARSP